MSIIDWKKMIEEEQVKKKPDPPKQPESGSGKVHPVEEKTPEDNLVIQFKMYLQAAGYYRGNVNDPNPDPAFIQAVTRLEDLISQALQKIAGSAPNSAKGLIWQGNQINPNTSPQDVEKALQMIANAGKRLGAKGNDFSNNLIVQAQATVDTYPEGDYTDTNRYPMGLKFVPTKDDVAGESVGGPLGSGESQIGMFEQNIPEKMHDCSPEEVRRERLEQLIRMYLEKKRKEDDNSVNSKA